MKKRVLSHLLPGIVVFTFLLGIHDGKIALWSGDDPEPAKVFPYRAALLPEPDQRRLETGIRIESMDELNRLMEAYLS